MFDEIDSQASCYASMSQMLSPTSPSMGITQGFYAQFGPQIGIFVLIDLILLFHGAYISHDAQS